MKSICVFCGSKPGKSGLYENAAVELGFAMAEKNIQLIYGGGGIGLMGIIADAIMKTGGTVVGVIPRFLSERELGHSNISELILVESMHLRKQKMAELADGFIALPGGFGTLEELCEILTWRQLQLVTKPIGILNVNGFYDHLEKQLSHMVQEGFLEEEHKRLLIIENDPQKLINKLLSFSMPEKQEIDKT